MSVQITLERDGHDQPWGFRLQGGVDVGLPLSVLRVLVGTPAEVVLKKGDVISKIGNTGTHNLSHQQAVDLFNCAGNQLNVTLKRAGPGGVVATSSQPSVSSLQASAAIRQQQQQQQAVVAAPSAGNTCEPYRTLPLIQPSVKVLNEFGAGTYSHLKLQEEICTGVREPQLVPVTPAQAQALKANEFIMKQKVVSMRSRSPDPSVSIRSLLRPTPLFRGRPAWKDNSFSSVGRNCFRLGGQMIALKPAKSRIIPGAPMRTIGAFKPKPLMSPNMWRTMLKATPVKAAPVKKEKKKREPLPEITLRKEQVIRIATRDIMEEYCDQVVKEGLPGKKFKPRNLKPKVHEGIVGPAKMTEVEVLFLQGKRQVQMTVVIRRFEEYEDFFTIGDKTKLPPGPCASFTFSLDYMNGMKPAAPKIPEKTFETVDVEQTVNVMACYDPMNVEAY